jgi:hypothetical protein
MKKIRKSKKLKRQKVNHLNSKSHNRTLELQDGLFSSYHNQALLGFHLYQLVNFRDTFDAWDPNDNLENVIQDCAELSLALINPTTFKYEVQYAGRLLMQRFDSLKLVNQHLVNSFLFPAATQLIRMFVGMKVLDYEGYQNIAEQLDGLPDEVTIIINERIQKRMLITGVEQQQFMTRLATVVSTELRYLEEDEFERYLSQINQFVIMLTGTRISLESTIH